MANKVQIQKTQMRSSPKNGVAISRSQLVAWLDQTLSPQHFKDYSPNGLQVQGSEQICRLACAVTASLAAIEGAAALGAQALLVHHGYFWRGEDPCLVGAKYRRIKALLDHNISLFGYHLPLDAHPELGNNAQLGLKLGWEVQERFGDQNIICATTLAQPLNANGLSKLIKRHLKRAPLLVGDLSRVVKRIAWCTGGAQDMLQEAIDQGCDAFVSGEISERTTHLAREAGVIYVAAGHHATELYGVQAVAEMAAKALGIQAVFVEDPNPV